MYASPFGRGLTENRCAFDVGCRRLRRDLPGEGDAPVPLRAKADPVCGIAVSAQDQAVLRSFEEAKASSRYPIPNRRFILPV